MSRLRFRTVTFGIAMLAAFAVLTKTIACTPEQAHTAVDIAQGVEQVVHAICTIAGVTDAVCVERVLAERRLASLRAVGVGDAGE